MLAGFHQIDVRPKPLVIADRDGLTQVLNALGRDEAVVLREVRFAIEVEQRLQCPLLNAAAVRGHRMKLGECLPQSPAHRPARNSQKIPSKFIHRKHSI